MMTLEDLEECFYLKEILKMNDLLEAIRCEIEACTLEDIPQAQRDHFRKCAKHWRITLTLVATGASLVTYGHGGNKATLTCADALFSIRNDFLLLRMTVREQMEEFEAEEEEEESYRLVDTWVRELRTQFIRTFGRAMYLRLLRIGDEEV